MAILLDISLPSLVLVGLCLSMIKLSVTSVRPPSNNAIFSPRAISVVLVGLLCVVIRNHFELVHHSFILGISFCVSLFLPYLSKTSKHRDSFKGRKRRSWNDRLISTSGAYLLASLFAFVYGQNQMAIVCFITSVGSSLYHRFREMVYFNLDNIFATSLLIVFVYTLMSSYHHHELYFTLGAVGLPVCVFLIVYCGMPADIILANPKGTSTLLCCIRAGRELYDTIHNLWHLASGMGPFMAVWYFDHLASIDPIISDFAINTLPTISLAISLSINIVGNIVGIMPLE